GAGLRGLLVERLVDVGDDQRLDRRREPLQLAGLRLDGIAQWEIEAVQELPRRLAHHHDELRLDDVQLPRQPGPGLFGILAVELEAVRAVDRHRVDAQALQRLQDRLARAPVEGDAFLYL